MKETEREYNYSVAENKDDLYERGVDFGEALTDYRAGQDVRFDVVDAAD